METGVRGTQGQRGNSRWLTALSLIVIPVLGIVGTQTGFRPVEPTRSDAVTFLHLYYRDVVTGRARSAWDQKLTSRFKEDRFTILGQDFNDYEQWWQSVQRVEVGVVSMNDRGEFETNLTYTKRSGQRSAPERTVFRLSCPTFTAVTILGCGVDNLRIDNTYVP